MSSLPVPGFPRRLFFFAAVSAGAFGCGGTVQVDDGEGGGDCCTMAPACPPDAQQVDSCESEQCFTVEACCTSVLCEPTATCAAEPTCEPNESQVESCGFGASCREVTLCGKTIICEAFCTAVPACDNGDEEVESCPPDVACYSVELCGSTISCIDNGLPHGCPEVPPLQFDPCTTFGLVCEYPLPNDPLCAEVWTCTDQTAPAPGGAPVPDQSTTWQPGGVVCSDGPAP